MKGGVKMEDEVIKELHDIREELYEETKNMTFEERRAYIRKEADEVRKRIETKRKEPS